MENPARIKYLRSRNTIDKEAFWGSVIGLIPFISGNPALLPWAAAISGGLLAKILVIDLKQTRKYNQELKRVDAALMGGYLRDLTERVTIDQAQERTDLLN